MKTLQLPPFATTPGTGGPPKNSGSSGHDDEFRRLVPSEDAVGRRDGLPPRGHSHAPGHSTSGNDVKAQDSDEASPGSDDDEEGNSPDPTDIAQFPAISGLIMESRKWSKPAGNNEAEHRDAEVEQSDQTRGAASHIAEGPDGLSAEDRSVTDRQRKADPANAAHAAMTRESTHAVPADGIDTPEQVRASVGAEQVYAQGTLRRASESVSRPASVAATNQTFPDASSIQARRDGTFFSLRSDDGVAGVPDERSETTEKGSARGNAALSTEIALAAAKYGVKTADKNAAQTEPVAVILPRAELMAAERHTSTLTPAGTLASAMALEPSWRPAAVAAMSHTPSHLAPNGHATLQVQLTPHHLGVVTARLILTGGQLEVEIEASSAAAHEHLKGEEHVIEKAIRNLGYDVGQVRITQSIVAHKDDSALPSSNLPTRDQTSGNAMSSGGEGRSNGQHGGRDESEGSGGFGERAHDADRNRRGLYI